MIYYMIVDVTLPASSRAQNESRPSLEPLEAMTWATLRCWVAVKHRRLREVCNIQAIQPSQQRKRVHVQMYMQVFKWQPTNSDQVPSVWLFSDQNDIESASIYTLGWSSFRMSLVVPRFPLFSTDRVRLVTILATATWRAGRSASPGFPLPLLRASVTPRSGTQSGTVWCSDLQKHLRTTCQHIKKKNIKTCHTVTLWLFSRVSHRITSNHIASYRITLPFRSPLTS